MGLSFSNGSGADAQLTVSMRNGFRPHTSDRAPTSGAQRNDSNPFITQQRDNTSYTGWLQKNCANLFSSELRQISTNFDIFWQKDGKEAKISTFHMT